MPKRPALEHDGSSNTAAGDSQTRLTPPAKRAHIPQFLSGVSIHIIPAKLTSSLLAHLCCLSESHGASLVASSKRADIVLTAVHARKRLERHMDWAEGGRRWILGFEWLDKSAAEGRMLPFEEYLAIPSLRPGASTPPRSSSPVLSEDGSLASVASMPSSPPVGPSGGIPVDAKLIDRNLQEPVSSPGTTTVTQEVVDVAVSKMDIPQKPYPPQEDITLTFTSEWPIPTSRYACKRRTPLITPNTEVLNLLKTIMRSRELEGESRSALSYARAISVLKAYPRRVTAVKQIASLPGVGPKVSHLVEQFLETGTIAEADKIAESERFQSLSELSDVHTVGPTTARALYAKGIRNVPELRHWVSQGHGGEVLRMALEVHEDLMVRIPRQEVELIAQYVKRALDLLLPGCEQTIVGGHRRGKSTSGDVDVVFTHPIQGKEDGLVDKIVNHLQDTGFITHVFGTMHPGHNPFSTSSHTRSKIQTQHPSSHFDTLSKALVVCRIPESEGGSGLHRRLDLICAPYDVYWTAVLGWSGSKQFERDLRLWAKEEMGIKFDSSGLTRLRDTQPAYVNSEKGIFELLDLEWVPPYYRNADM